MYIVFIIMAVIFLLIGISINHFKWYFLISGYNTMTKEEQSRVDIEKAGKLVGNFGYTMFFIQLSAAAAGYFKYEFLAFMVSFISIIFGTVIVIIRSTKYDGNDLNADGTVKKEKKILIGAISVFFTIVVIGVCSLMYASNKPSDIIIGENYIEIKGMYKTNINFDDMKEVTLEETIPKVLRKTNGSNLGSILKGNFKLEDIGHAKLFINKDKPPFIIIKLEQDYVIINRGSRQDTENLFKDIKEKINEKR